MKFFLVFCLIVFTKIFATDSDDLRKTLFATRGSAARSIPSSALSQSGESWEYVIGSYRNSRGIIATRTNMSGLRSFFIDVLQCSTCEDFFSKPKHPCDRHLIGIFTLTSMPTYAERVSGRSKNMQQITTHRMHLRMIWYFDDEKNLVCGPLEQLK